MSCREIHQRLGAYVDGELPERERAAIEEHLLACMECSEMAQEWQSLDSTASRAKVPAVTGDDWARVWAGILAGTTGESRGPRAARRERAALAGVVASLWSARGRRAVLAIASAAALVVLTLLIVLDRGGEVRREPGHETLTAKSVHEPKVETKTEDYAERPGAPQEEIQPPPDLDDGR